MPQASTTPTFRRQGMPNPEGIDTVNGQSLSVEFLTADPSDLTTNFPRIWVNITSGTMKYTADGTTVKTVTAT